MKDQYEQLMKLARDKSVEGRRILVDTITDLFEERTGALTARERDLMNEILRKLISEVEIPVRQALASRMADRPDAPEELIKQLAKDDIEVAHPVLVHSTVLRDETLVEIIRHRTLQHQLAIAIRDDVSESVSEALIEQDQEDVVKALLENSNARISEAAMEYVVARAKTFDPYQKPLLNRPDLDPAIAKKLYWWVSAALRRHILENYKVDPLDLDVELESAVRDMIHEVRDDQASAFAKAERLARRLKEANALTAAMLVQVMRQGEIALFEAMFAELTELRVTLVRRLLYEPGGEGMAIACKAAEVEKPTFASLFLLSRKARDGAGMVDPKELSRVLAFYDDLDRKSAVTLVERWRRDPDFLEAQWQIDLGSGAEKT